MIDSIHDMYSTLYDVITPMSHHTRWWITLHLRFPELRCSHILICSIEEESVSIGLVDLTICCISEETEELVDMDAFGFSLHGYRIELANREYISYLVICPT